MPETLEDQAATELADALGESKPRARPSRAGKRGTRVRAAQAKPKPPPARKPTTQRPPARPPLDRKLEELLGGLSFGLSGYGLMTGRQALVSDALAISEHSRSVASAMVKVADEHPAFRRALELLTTTSTYGELVMALAPLAMAIASNHGWIAPPAMPTVADGVPVAA